MGKAILHITPYGKGYNIGNFAISLAIRKLLLKIYKDLTIVTYPAHGAIDAGLNKKIIYEANQWCDGIIVGGGNLYENNELFLDFNALESLQIPLLLFSISLGKIYVKGISLSRRTDVMPNETLINLHKYAAKSVTRDKATQFHMASLGIKNIQLGACPTLGLKNLVSRENLPYFDNKKILISIRNPELMNIPRSLKSKMPYIVNSLINLIKDRFNSNPVLLCHDQRDIGFASSFSNVDFYFTSDVYEYLGALNSADLVISMRIHATLPCLSYEIPVINLSYDERASSLMDTIGFSSWDINLVKDENQLLKLLNARLDDLELLKKTRNNSAIVWDKLLRLQENVLSEFK